MSHSHALQTRIQLHELYQINPQNKQSFSN
jgi:hypothetical protein